MVAKMSIKNSAYGGQILIKKGINTKNLFTTSPTFVTRGRQLKEEAERKLLFLKSRKKCSAYPISNLLTKHILIHLLHFFIPQKTQKKKNYLDLSIVNAVSECKVWNIVVWNIWLPKWSEDDSGTLCSHQLLVHRHRERTRGRCGVWRHSGHHPKSTVHTTLTRIDF